ncbi:MAG: peptidoglycan-binding domain-containing protein [Candidatus Nomurabacteria bacterium]|nr:peptidoglycan-binding domain-containing protein [Candidatus Nomurabacteria bacterium]
MSNLFKTKIFLGMMIVAIMFVGVFALNTAKATTDCTVVATMNIGSRGASVTCLQNKLGMTQVTGYYGSITKAAVTAYQAAHSLPTVGIVGPLTAASLNANTTTTTTTTTTTGALCPNGNLLSNNCAASTTTTTTVALCPNGMTLASNCMTGAGTVSTSGEGAVTVTFDATPINSTTVNRGENKAVMGIKVKATGSDMKVTRLWLDIGTRVWLSADSVTLMDGSTVLATLPLTSSTVTEVTVGSAWRLEFNGLNVTVPKDTTKVLTVKVGRPTATVADTDVVVATTSSLRAVDMAGITDTYTFSALGTRTWDLAASNAAQGTLTATLSSTSPVAQSVSGLSATAGTTTDVKLMDFDLKATDGAINVTDISGLITTDAGTCTQAQCLSTVELRDGTTVLDSVVGASTFDFAEQDITIAAGATKTLSIWAKVNHVAGSFVVAGDALHAVINNVDGTTGTSYTDASITPTVTGNAQYFFRYAPTITVAAGTIGTRVSDGTSTTPNFGGDYSLVFTVAAPSTSDIFVKTPAFAVGQPTVPTKTTVALGGVLTNSTAVSGATLKGSTLTTWDKIPAGQSRTFTITSNIPHGGTAGYVGVTLATNGINWSSSESDSTGTTQTWGLSEIKTNTVLVTAN